MRRARPRALLALALAAAMPALPAQAIMAGAFPDSPAARVDANVDTSPWRGVVAIQTPAGIFTGATLGRRHVLTAAHVFDSLPAAAEVQVIFNLSAGAVQRGVVRYTRHPDYVAFGVPDLRHDLALIELAADRPAASVAYAISAAPPAAGAVVTVVGYGASGNGNVGVSVPRSATVRRVGRNVLDVLITDGSGTVRLFHWDFDGPTAATNFLGGPTLGNALETTLAGGDSGAPVFVEAGDAPALVALGSFTGAFAGGPTAQGVFGTAAGGQVLAGYRPWIEELITASGYGENTEDIPLPPWALALLAAVFGASLLRSGCARHDLAAGDIVRSDHG